MTAKDIFRILFGADGTENQGSLRDGLECAAGFFIPAAVGCGLAALYATITGAW